jgi:hypothetical protein
MLDYLHIRFVRIESAVVDTAGTNPAFHGDCLTVEIVDLSKHLGRSDWWRS